MSDEPLKGWESIQVGPSFAMDAYYTEAAMLEGRQRLIDQGYTIDAYGQDSRGLWWVRGHTDGPSRVVVLGE